MKFDAIDRMGTGCSKWDGISEKFGRDKLLPLWVADMDIAAPQVAQDAIMQRAKHPIYAYTMYEDKFYNSIKEWYRSQFGWDIQKDWILPEHGVVVSLNLSIEAYTDIGDGIIIQSPIYPPFSSSIENHGRKILDNKLLFENGKTNIDFEDFEKKAKEAKMFMLCSPHNPSSRSWRADELERMVSICHDNGVIIVSDEIHSDLVFGSSHIPIASLPSASDISVTLHAPSKTFNIAGLNTSYLVIPDQRLRNRYNIAHKKSGLGNGNPFGIVALEAVYTGGREWLAELKKHIQNNALYIKTFIEENIPEIIVYEHEATFLIWLDCRGFGFDDTELSEFFVSEAGLGLNAGVSFGEAGSGFMRLNIGTSISILEQAMDNLHSAVKRIRIR